MVPKLITLLMELLFFVNNLALCQNLKKKSLLGAAFEPLTETQKKDLERKYNEYL